MWACSHKPTLNVQSRPQSGLKHRKKGWHAFQEPGTGQPAPHTSSNSPAVYMRPDRTVQADISASSFPSLSSAPTTAASQPKPAGWQNTSPDGKGKPHSTDCMHSPPQAQRQKAQYAAAVSPQIAQQAKHADSNSRDGMALSDAELAAITQLLSLHQWAEPGLVRVSRSSNIFFFCLRHLRCICARNL